MKVERLRLCNFRRFRHADVSLADGINVVKGPNESGKSTLVQALLAALYWKVDSNRREVRDSITWGEREGFNLELQGEVEGVSFHLVKDFSSRSARLSWDDEETEDGSEIGDQVKDWLGLGSELAFRSTAAIRQNEVSEIAAGRKELSESLQATVTGSEGGENALGAQASMEKEITRLLRGTRGPARNPGELARIMEEIEKISNRRDELRHAVERLVDARQRMEEASGECRNVEGRLETLQNLWRDSLEQQDIEEDIEDFQRRYRFLQSACSLVREDEELMLREGEVYGDLRQVLEHRREELGELELRRTGIAEGLGMMHDKLVEETRGARYAAWAPYLLVTGITLILVGAAGFELSPYMLMLTGVGLCLGMVALFPGRYLGFMRKGGEFSALEEQARDLEAKRREVEGLVGGIMVEAGCNSAERFNELKLGYLELLAHRKEIADKLEVLVPDGDIGMVEEEASRLAMEVSLRERRLKELKGRSVGPYRLQEIKREKEELEQNLGRLKDELIRLEVVLSDEGVEEELLRVEEELEFLESRRERLQIKAEALELAVTWLEKARREILASASRRLEKSIGDYMGRITANRYSSVYVDEEDFAIRVFSSDKGDRVEPEILSRGTVDQLYLAARFALVEVICEHEHPPLLLDDPFVTFDSGRLRGAMELIKELAWERQVIIFTCGDYYDAYADHAVELEAV
ncbi:MAG: AAA family ATPase [Actinomycetota bacterium]|nr:AAA family ATPase [Actinomycetota bacterium]